MGTEISVSMGTEIFVNGDGDFDNIFNENVVKIPVPIDTEISVPVDKIFLFLHS